MESMLPFPASLISRPIRPLKRVEYDKLVDEGFFQNERVELVFGMVVTMTPPSPQHAESVARVDDLLRDQLARRARVSCQNPFAATDDSEPQPDVFVFPNGDYWNAHPGRAYLVVEVSRSSLEYDRSAKHLLYGLSQVDEYWIVNHPDGVVEVYRDPHEGKWRSMTTHARGETVTMLAFADVQIAVADILPPIS